MLNVALVVLVHLLHGGQLATWLWGPGEGIGAEHDPAEGPAAAAPWWWWVALVVLLVGWRLVMYLMFVSQMAFYSTVADEAVGGTYMTMLNTVTNLGVMWPLPLALQSMDRLEDHPCLRVQGSTGGGEPEPEPVVGQSGHELSCATAVDRRRCVQAGGECVERQDGYAAVVLAVTVIGLVWILAAGSWFDWLGGLSLDRWKVGRAGGQEGEGEEAEEKERGSAAVRPQRQDRHDPGGSASSTNGDEVAAESERDGDGDEGGEQLEGRRRAGDSGGEGSGQRLRERQAAGKS